MKLYLIDGTFELFRSWFSFPSSINSDQVEVGALRGLLRSMVSLIKSSEEKYIAVTFDHTIESFRNDLFSGYKTGENIEPELLSQFELAEELVSSLGITVWPMVKFEADDAIATASRKWSKSSYLSQVVICSPDKDFYQIVDSDHIVLWDRIRNKVIDENAVIAKLGIKPHSIPDYLALVGDKADGIPGIPRWGAKSASIILAEYNHIEMIPKDPTQWPQLRGLKSLAENLHTHSKELALYKKL